MHSFMGVVEVKNVRHCFGLGTSPGGADTCVAVAVYEKPSRCMLRQVLPRSIEELAANFGFLYE